VKVLRYNNIGKYNKFISPLVVFDIVNENLAILWIERNVNKVNDGCGYKKEIFIGQIFSTASAHTCELIIFEILNFNVRSGP
jgi:hypothetical protein